MKKAARRIVSVILAVMMVLSVMVITPSTDAQAGDMSIPSKVRCGVGIENNQSVDLYLGGYGHYIQMVPNKNKKFHVKRTRVNTRSGYAKLTMYADKNGVYKISFYVKSMTGRTVGSKRTITVYAAGTGDILRQVTVGNITTKNENVKTSIYTNQKKARIYVKGLPGIKLKKITVSKYTADGEWKTTTIKNGQWINIGTVGYSDLDEDLYDKVIVSRARDLIAETTITVYYVDTFKKASYSKTEEYPSRSFTIYKKASDWAK